MKNQKNSAQNDATLESKKSRVGTYVLWSIAIVIITTIIVFAAKNSVANIASTSSSATDMSSTSNTASDIQIVNVKVVGGDYVFTPSIVEVGKVRLVADMKTFYGCSRSIVIKEFGVKTQLSEQKNVVDFDATKKGTFTMACSMNMYRGSFTVV